MEMKTINEQVKQLLINDKKCRDSDMYLFGKYISTYHKDYRNIPVAILLMNNDFYKITSYESISRARRKVQAEEPELMSSVKAGRRKQAQKEAILEWAKG